MKFHLNVCRRLFYATLTASMMFSTVSHAQGLLDKVNVQEEKSLSLQIYEDIFAPILNYDENAITVEVLDDLSIFEGNNEYWRTENPNFNGEFYPPKYDSDRDIYRVLGAKSDELLLKVNIEVEITPEHIKKIDAFLNENSNYNLTYDGTPNDHNTTGRLDTRKIPTRFYVGSFKGNERTRTHFTQLPYNLAPNIFSRLGLKSDRANDPFGFLIPDERKGLYFAQPYKMFAFNQGLENGVLCKNILTQLAEKRALEHVTKWDKNSGEENRKPVLGNHALSGGFFYNIRPRLKLSCVSSTGN